MPWGLKRYQNTGDLHFITFSCYHREPFFATSYARRVFEETLEDVRRWYGVDIKGYVVMPEHVHLLLSEPERSSLRVVIQMLKQITAQKIGPKLSDARQNSGRRCFWQVRYYDFNVRTREKQIEKLRYLHRNPVKRGAPGSPFFWANLGSMS
jgi:putative transposase